MVSLGSNACEIATFVTWLEGSFPNTTHHHQGIKMSNHSSKTLGRWLAYWIRQLLPVESVEIQHEDSIKVVLIIHTTKDVQVLLNDSKEGALTHSGEVTRCLLLKPFVFLQVKDLQEGFVAIRICKSREPLSLTFYRMVLR